MTKDSTPKKERVYDLAANCISLTFAAFMVMHGEIRVKPGCMVSLDGWAECIKIRFNQ